MDHRVGLDVDDDGAAVRGRGLGVPDRLLELLRRAHLDDGGAEAAGVGGQVDRQPVAVQPAGGVVAEAVGGAEALRTELLRQRADGVEAVVLDQDDDDLDAVPGRR